MKSYMKPTISLVVTNGNGGFGSCVVKVDEELIESILGGVIDLTPDSFGLNEACKHQVPIDMYCKFTSADLGAAHAFES